MVFTAAGTSPDDQAYLRRYISDRESRQLSFKKDQDRQRFRNLYEQKILQKPMSKPAITVG